MNYIWLLLGAFVLIAVIMAVFVLHLLRSRNIFGSGPPPKPRPRRSDNPRSSSRVGSSSNSNSVNPPPYYSPGQSRPPPYQPPSLNAASTQRDDDQTPSSSSNEHQLATLAPVHLGLFPSQTRREVWGAGGDAEEEVANAKERKRFNRSRVIVNGVLSDGRRDVRGGSGSLYVDECRGRSVGEV